MTFGFSSLQHVLGDWPTAQLPHDPPQDGIFSRIIQILAESQTCKRLVHRADFQSLIRHALCRQSAIDKRPASLKVPSRDDWPSQSDWQRFGVSVAYSVGDGFVIEARPWQASWMEEGRYSVFEDVFAGVQCEHEQTCRIDPCIEAVTGFKTYKSPGQREAIRSVFFAETGSTLIVTLPTGSGKSLVGQVPALLGEREGNLTVFVVPTVALALDQELQVKKLFRYAHPNEPEIPLAWHSGLSAHERKLIKQSIRSGRQRILFTSPEAVCGTLRYALYEATQKGFLKYFIVDEAHLVAQWGDEFRPDFQAISGIRRGLLRVCGARPFKTVLMTATLTEESLQTLEILFGPPNRLQIVSAVHLRPEPRYWINKATDFIEKKKKVLETIRHGPRPFILYVTTKADARNWFDILKTEGFSRMGCFHGDTPNEQRRELIEKWAENKIDAMVATSAFGVGVSKDDIRMIIHVCVPETLDRFYQEVGRSGRDNRASASILIYSEQDVNLAERMGSPALISKENGLARWKWMMQRRESVPGAPALIRVDIRVVPPRLQQQSDFNDAWNLRTILLLARANIIALDSEPPPRPERLIDESEEAYDTRLEGLAHDYFSHVVLRIVNPKHFEDETWDTEIAAVRADSTRAIKRNFDLMCMVIDRREEVSEALVDLYQINRPGLFVQVYPMCGGCPRCREREQGPDFQGPLLAIPIKRVPVVDTSKWKEKVPWLPDFPVVVTYEPGNEEHFRRETIALLELLIEEHGVREISVDAAAHWERDPAFRNLYRLAPERFVIHRELREDEFDNEYIPLAKVSILYPWSEEPIPDVFRLSMRPFHVILAPSDCRDRANRTRRYCDTASNCITLQNLIDRLRQ